MKPKLRAVGVALISSAMLAGLTPPAHALIDVMVEEIAETVDTATDPALKGDDLNASKQADGTFAAPGADTSSTVTMPANVSGKVTASKNDGTSSYSISVSLGSASAAVGKLASDGSVVYNTPSVTDVTIRPTDDGFRIHTVIDSSSAPTEYVHSLTLPSGATVALGKDVVVPTDSPEDTQGSTDNGAYVFDAQGALLGVFGSPWAKDANGTAVPTHFELRSGDLVQVVDHTSSTYAYPIVADPYLGINLIKSATWVYHSGYGWTFQVTPTWWARAHAGSYTVGYYGWLELYNRYRYNGLNTNLGGMKDQYICHQQFVAVWSPTKSTWNLDEWRPDWSYLSTVNAKCNPGGSVFFD